MTKSSSAAARAVAAIALICGMLAIVVVVAASLNGGGESQTGSNSSRQHVTKRNQARPPVPAAYVVQTGDTLTAIAHKTGVSVARIQTLNPGVDPQILIAGEKLKLR